MKYEIPETENQVVDEPVTASFAAPLRLEITLEENAVVADIKKALKMIRGVASVRVAHSTRNGEITPQLAKSINKARKEYKKGETITCSTPDEMRRYFDSL